MTVTTRYSVTGMSCQHCVDAVTAEVGKLAGVEQVEVDLPTGTVSVTSIDELSRDDVVAAVDEAGYDLADATAPPEGS